MKRENQIICLAAVISSAAFSPVYGQQSTNQEQTVRRDQPQEQLDIENLIAHAKADIELDHSLTMMVT